LARAAITAGFLRAASAEKTGLLEDAIERVTNLRDRAQALIGVISERPIDDAIREYVDEAVALKYAILRFDEGLTAPRGYVGRFTLEVARFVITCEATLREFKEQEQLDFWPDGWAWAEWVRQIARVAILYKLPHRVSKDPSSNRSPFVALVQTLQRRVPVEYARGKQSEGALAPVAQSNGPSNRDANGIIRRQKKTRTSQEEGIWWFPRHLRRKAKMITKLEDLMRRPSAFRKTDVTRAAKAVLAAGLPIARVEVDRDGSIVIVPGKPAEADETPDDLQKLLWSRAALLDPSPAT
jgi:hypothetical protein